jgi:hypothetical protein
MRIRISVAAIAALVGCGSNNGNNVTCGDGTTLVDGVCEVGSGGSGGGNGDTCGSGTMLQGTTCVATGGGDASTPTISMITPGEAGVMGGGPFLIDGTGFDGDNITSLGVFFGETMDQNCEATIVLATSTEISGIVPPFCDINVTVSVITNIGTATTPFHYDAIFAADGDNVANTGFEAAVGGELWVIDPFASTAYDFGAILDGSGTDYPMAGLAFDSTGAVWGVTTGDGDGDLDEVSQLVTLDPVGANGPTVTIIGDAADGNGDGYILRDLKIINGTMYAYGYDVSGESITEGLVSIDQTGAVTPLGTPAALNVDQEFATAGIAYDGTTTWVAAHFAGSDANMGGATGELDSADLTTGVLTANANPLDWGIGAPVNTMDVLTLSGTPNILAVIDNGFYGALQGLNNEGLGEFFGQTLAIIDPTAASGAVVNPVFSMPSQIGFQAAVGAIAIPAATTQTLQVVRKHIDPTKWQKLGTTSAKPTVTPLGNAHHLTGKLVSHRTK